MPSATPSGVLRSPPRGRSPRPHRARSVRRGEETVPNSATIVVNKAVDVLGVAEHLLTGEALYREGKPDEAFAALREAVRREDALRYGEPPDWSIPVRHALGAVLMQSGRYGEAERVYRDDLERHPENGWSLFGLSRSLELQEGRRGQACSGEVREAWADADVKLSSRASASPGYAVIRDTGRVVRLPP